MKRKAPTLIAIAINTPTIAPAAAPALFIPFDFGGSELGDESGLGVLVTVVTPFLVKVEVGAVEDDDAD